MKVTVKITGDKAILGSLSLMNVKGRQRLEKAVDRSSANVLAGAIARVHVRSGELKKTIRRKISTSGMSATIMAGYGQLERKGKAAGKRARGIKVNQGKGVYAPVEEFGSQTNPANPFLFPALEAEKPAFYADCEKAMDATCAEVKGV